MRNIIFTILGIVFLSIQLMAQGGGSTPEAGYYFTGWIDEFRVWNEEVGSVDINFWMHQPVTGSHAPSYAATIDGYFKLDTDWDQGGWLADAANNVGGSEDNDLTNNGTFNSSSKSTPIGDFPSGYTTDAEASWNKYGIGWSDESYGLALQDWNTASILLSEFFAYATDSGRGLSTSDLPTGLDERAACIWYIDDLADDSLNLKFDVSDFDASGLEVVSVPIANYYLLQRWKIFTGLPMMIHAGIIIMSKRLILMPPQPQPGFLMGAEPTRAGYLLETSLQNLPGLMMGRDTPSTG